jgi:hypothetical protein
VKRKVPDWEPFAREPIVNVCEEKKNRNEEEREEKDGDEGEEKGFGIFGEGKF